MARKKRTPAHARLLPLSKGEIWEVGRRALEVSIADLVGKNERPEVLLVVQAGDEGGVVLGDATTSSAPPAVLVDVVVRAMREPLLGKPRRPEVIRVGSAAEAELLRSRVPRPAEAAGIIPRPSRSRGGDGRLATPGQHRPVDSSRGPDCRRAPTGGNLAGAGAH